MSNRSSGCGSSSRGSARFSLSDRAGHLPDGCDLHPSCVRLHPGTGSTGSSRSRTYADRDILSGLRWGDRATPGFGRDLRDYLHAADPHLHGDDAAFAQRLLHHLHTAGPHLHGNDAAIKAHLSDHVHAVRRAMPSHACDMSGWRGSTGVRRFPASFVGPVPDAADPHLYRNDPADESADLPDSY